MAEVQILSRVEAQAPDPESGVPKPVIAVTYSTAKVPPRTVTVPRDAGEDAVAEAVRQDLASLSNGPPQTLQI